MYWLGFGSDYVTENIRTKFKHEEFQSSSGLWIFFNEMYNAHTYCINKRKGRSYMERALELKEDYCESLHTGVLV